MREFQFDELCGLRQIAVTCATNSTDMNEEFRHIYVYDNKVRELATMCLLWQHWTKALVWFYDVDISAFHSCVVVIYGSLFLSDIYYCLRVLWCSATRMSELELEKRTKIKFLVVS